MDAATLEALDPATQAEYNWKWSRVPFVIKETDLDKNEGEEGVIDILSMQEEWAKMTMSENLSDGLFGTNSSNSKQMDGLQNLYGASGTAYGGLTDTDFTTPASWLTSINTMINTGAATTLTAQDIRRLISSVTRGMARPNLMLTNWPVFNKIWGIAQNNQRFGSEKVANLGFDSVVFEGIPIMPDEHSPGTGYGTGDNWLMALNLDYLQFWIHTNKAFLSRVYQPIPQVEAYIGKILLGCNLSTSNRRMHSVIKVINPTC